MFKFKPNRSQRNELHALAYRIADNSYMIERYGAEDAAIELAENHKTIMLIFDLLDRFGVPFWVQNKVIFAAEKWRDYKAGKVAEIIDQDVIYLK